MTFRPTLVKTDTPDPMAAYKTAEAALLQERERLLRNTLTQATEAAATLKDTAPYAGECEADLNRLAAVIFEEAARIVGRLKL